MLARSLFETKNDVEHRLCEEVKTLKDDLKIKIEKFDDVNKLMTRLSDERKSSNSLMDNLTNEVERLKGAAEKIKELRKKNEELEVSLKESQLEIISFRDDLLERAKS